MTVPQTDNYFSRDGNILATDILRPLREAKGDLEIAEIVGRMNMELEAISGLEWRLVFDQTNMSRSVAARIHRVWI